MNVKGSINERTKVTKIAANRGLFTVRNLTAETNTRRKLTAPRIPEVAINSRKYEDEKPKFRFQIFGSRLNAGSLNLAKSMPKVP